MSVTLGQVRDRMRYLVGASTAMPELTTDQENDLIHEAVNIWRRKQRRPSSDIARAIQGGAKYCEIDNYNGLRIIEVLGVYTGTMPSAESTIGKECERASVAQLRMMQETQTGASTAERTHYAVEILPTTLGLFDSTVRVWVYPYPLAGSVVGMRAVLEHAKLTNDAHTFRMLDCDSWVSARISAAIGAEVVGRSAALIDELWAPIPGAAKIRAARIEATQKVPQ